MSKHNRGGGKSSDKASKPSHEQISENKHGFIAKLKHTYTHDYKKLFLIVIALTLFAVGSVLFTYSKTGDFTARDVSLKGGISITVTTPYSDIVTLENSLKTSFPKASFNLRTIESGGVTSGIIIEASDIQESDLLAAIQEKTGLLTKDQYSVESMGSSLGESFFLEMFKSMIIAFLFMGAVFFFYFSDRMSLKLLILLLALINFFVLFIRSEHDYFFVITIIVSLATLFIYVKYNLPTLAAVISAFLDIFITLGIMNILGIRLTAGGIAAYLMMISYSIDTSILLSTKLLKEKREDVDTALFGAMKTGLTMSAAGIVATGISFLLSNNLVLKQIMLILVVGLIIDVITTWIGNVALLRIYLGNKQHVKA